MTSFLHEFKKTIKRRAKSESNLRRNQLQLFDRTKIYAKVSKDIENINDYVAVFSKSLPHDANGIVDKSQIELLLKAIKKGNRKYVDQMTLGSTKMKLANLMAFMSTELSDMNISSFKIRSSPEFSSAEFAGDMVELYEMELCRDVNFNDFDTTSAVIDATTDLNQLSDFRGPKPVTTKNFFRGNTVGDLTGPYVSQFLLMPFMYGVCRMVQEYNFPPAGSDYLQTETAYLSCQNGTVTQTSVPMDIAKRYINTPRDLAEYVHNDTMCQAYYNAHMILQGLKVPTNPGSPYGTTIKNESPFVTMGPPDIQDLIHKAGRLALHASWLQKVSFMRIRPEVYAYEVDRAMSKNKNYGVHNDVLQSNILPKIFSKYGNYLLSSCYPEGSPTHPSFPAGHACIAGASVTILKAFYDGSFILPQSYVANGSSLNTIPDQLTVNNELDKLASNIAFGRNIAGVHYRSDGEEGLKLGEEVAINVLMNHVKRYNEKVALQITKRDGSKIVIKN
ncbi:PAP2 superfamily protein [Indivirus ILV1]|uniref:PAP2 superfamily protein n=1 Tax=Indivirus ILV1 TaxID=1977633 RepID=A0A1V0SD32_9VIRU|nr:PAP2 superfamily protein [Indivirus ILV1]